MQYFCLSLFNYFPVNEEKKQQRNKQNKNTNAKERLET